MQLDYGALSIGGCMKVGDLVKYNATCSNKHTTNPIMLVIETGVYTGRCDVKVVWGDGKTTTMKSSLLELVNESR